LITTLIQSKFGAENLIRFSNLVNRETLWVVSEIVGETNLSKRVKLVKLFLKIARHCREAQNYNSMFAITSGLAHNAVSRYGTMFENLSSLHSGTHEVCSLCTWGTMNFTFSFWERKDRMKTNVIAKPG
jgi:son of sevenless-like protein